MERVPLEEEIRGVVFVPEEQVGSVVVLSGSGGGIPEGYARKLAESGLIAFGLAYFGVEGLPPVLEEVPVEIVERGIELFRSRFNDGAPANVIGSSKGAELALLAASLLPGAIKGVVAIAPTNVTWYGLGQHPDRSSWTWRDRSVPFVPLKGHPTTSDEGMRIDGCYDLGLHDATAIEAATIDVERCGGRILLLSGSDDHMWPSAAMAERIVRRLEHRDLEHIVESVVYPGAGHAFLHREFYANRNEDGRAIWDFGGSSAADVAAAEDAWQRIVSFLGS